MCLNVDTGNDYVVLGLRFCSDEWRGMVSLLNNGGGRLRLTLIIVVLTSMVQYLISVTIATQIGLAVWI